MTLSLSPPLLLVQKPHECMGSSVYAFIYSVMSFLLFVTPWSVAHHAPLSIGFSRQKYWSGLQFSSPGDLPNPGIELRSPALQAHPLPSEPQGKTMGHGSR